MRRGRAARAGYDAYAGQALVAERFLRQVRR